MKKLFKHIKNNKGFTFVECVVAIAIFAVFSTVSFGMFNNSVKFMNDAKKEETARSEAQTQFAADDFKDENDNYEIILPEDVVVMMSVGVENVKDYYGVERHYTISTGEVETIVISITFIRVKDEGVEVGTNRPYTDSYYETSDNRKLVVRQYK